MKNIAGVPEGKLNGLEKRHRGKHSGSILMALWLEMKHSR